ncbi:hypothetical protein [Rhizobium sp. PAMB 3182]
MAKKEDGTRVDNILDRLKNNSVIATVVVAATIFTGLYSFWGEIRKFYGEFWETPIILVQMNLASDSDGFFHEEEMTCKFDGKSYPTYLPPAVSKTSRPVSFDFVFQNAGEKEALFTQIDVNVLAAEQVSGGSPGIITANHEYVLDLEHRTGKQIFKLKTVYRIPGNDSGAFMVTFKPATKGIGLCWILNVDFHTSLGTIRSQDFSFVTSNF